MPFLCYSDGMDHLVHTFIDTVTLFPSQKNQLNVNQSSLKNGHSTETALLSVTVALQIAKADSKWSVLILLDLSVTFDTVNHQILLSTVIGSALHWFESYLSGRSFRVSRGGEKHQLVTGVLQESVVGPLLFTIYTTSLGPIIQGIHGFSYHCYADDTQLIFHFNPTIQQ